MLETQSSCDGSGGPVRHPGFLGREGRLGSVGLPGPGVQQARAGPFCGWTDSSCRPGAVTVEFPCGEGSPDCRVPVEMSPKS